MLVDAPPRWSRRLRYAARGAIFAERFVTPPNSAGKMLDASGEAALRRVLPSAASAATASMSVWRMMLFERRANDIAASTESAA